MFAYSWNAALNKLHLSLGITSCSWRDSWSTHVNSAGSAAIILSRLHLLRKWHKIAKPDWLYSIRVMMFITGYLIGWNSHESQPTHTVYHGFRNAIQALCEFGLSWRKKPELGGGGGALLKQHRGRTYAEKGFKNESSLSKEFEAGYVSVLMKAHTKMSKDIWHNSNRSIFSYHNHKSITSTADFMKADWIACHENKQCVYCWVLLFLKSHPTAPIPTCNSFLICFIIGFLHWTCTMDQWNSYTDP